MSSSEYDASCDKSNITVGVIFLSAGADAGAACAANAAATVCRCVFLFGLGLLSCGGSGCCARTMRVAGCLCVGFFRAVEKAAGSTVVFGLIFGVPRDAEDV